MKTILCLLLTAFAAVRAEPVVIPPCHCGCMVTGNCKCANCCKRTADPTWQDPDSNTIFVSTKAEDEAVAALALAKAARSRNPKTPSTPVTPAKPVAADGYEACMNAVMAGQRVTLAVGTFTVDGFHTDAVDGFANGVYVCYLQNGTPVMERMAANGTLNCPSGTCPYR